MVRFMIRYGAKVIIRDGSMLDGTVGIVYQVRDGQIVVLLDREVLWVVPEHRLELANGEVNGPLNGVIS